MGDHTEEGGGSALSAVSITSLSMSLAKKALMTEPNCEGGLSVYSSCEGREKKKLDFQTGCSLLWNLR